MPYIFGFGQAEELLTSDNKWRDNAAHMYRMRSRLMNRLKMCLSLSLVLSAIGVPTDYLIGLLMLSVGPYTTDKEMDHTV